MPMAAHDLVIGNSEQIEAMFPKLDASQIARLAAFGQQRARSHTKSFWNWAICITASSSF